MFEAAGEQGIRAVDAVEFVAASVLPTLPDGDRIRSLTLHPTFVIAHPRGALNRLVPRAGLRTC